MVAFDKCHKSYWHNESQTDKECASEEEFIKWAADKYIVLLVNDARYVQREYRKDKRVKKRA